MASHLTSPRPHGIMDLTRGLYASLRVEAHSEVGDANWEIFQFRSPKGALVPLCFKRGVKILGILPSMDENPPSTDISSAARFQQEFPGARVIFATSGRRATLLSREQAIVPYPLLLRPKA